MKKFLILGGGIAGIEAAIKLRAKGYEVTLVSDRDYLFVYPISIWIPIKGISFDDSKIDLAQLQKVHGFNLIIDKVEQVDAINRVVKLSNGEQIYDYLFIALGMQKVQMKGAENTHTICGAPAQSLDIANELEKLVEAGRGKIAIGFGGNPKDAKGSAVRGGPAFELLFNISTYLKRKKLLNKFELNFVAPMAEPGKKMGDHAVNNLTKFFKRYQINPHVGTKIIGFNKNEVLFEGGKTLQSDLIIFIAGGAGHAALTNSGLPLSEAGFVHTLPTCQVDGFSDIYAIGDTAELLGPSWAAKQGHTAEVMADVAVYNAHQQILGSTKTRSYVDKVNIMCMMDSGDGAALITRTTKKESMLMLPIVGHWLKKAWGFYYKNTKLKRFPRIPGM